MPAELLTCGYSYHSEPFVNHHKNGLLSYLFRLQTVGYSEVTVNGNVYPQEAGSLLMLGPGDTYELRIDEHDFGPNGRVVSSGDYYLFCKGAWIDDWWRSSVKQQIAQIDPDDRLLNLWRHLVLENRRRQQEDNRELTGHLLRALSLVLIRAVSETTPSLGPSFTASRLKRFIEEHATRTFKIEDAARHAGLSISRAVHLFKECYGKTMVEYALEIHLSVAIERMKYTSMTLEQIAESCGFGSYSYFHRVFKEKHGTSPRGYRNG